MDTQALKYEIIEWVTKTNDHSLLSALKSLKDSSAGTTGDWYDELSVEETASIKRGMKTMKRKKF